MAKTIFNDVGTAGVVLREHFGMSFDGWGNAYADRAPVDFSSLIKQLTLYYDKWTIKDYDEFLRSLIVDK